MLGVLHSEHCRRWERKNRVALWRTRVYTINRKKTTRIRPFSRTVSSPFQCDCVFVGNPLVKQKAGLGYCQGPRCLNIFCRIDHYQRVSRWPCFWNTRINKVCYNTVYYTECIIKRYAVLNSTVNVKLSNVFDKPYVYNTILWMFMMKTAQVFHTVNFYIDIKIVHNI